MVAKSAGEEPNSEKEALLNELPKYIEKVEKMWVHLTNIAEDYDALETKFNEIQNVPQFDKAIFEKEWEETFSEEKNKIDRSLSIGIGQIDKGIAEIDASNKRNIDLFRNLEKNTEKEIDDIKKEYKSLDEKFNQVVEIKNDIDNLKKNTLDLINKAKDKMDEKITESLLQQRDGIDKSIRGWQSSLEKYIQQNLLENAQQIKQGVKSELTSSNKKIKESLATILNAELSAYEKKLSELKTTLQSEFSEKLETLSGRFSDTDSNRQKYSSTSLLEEMVEMVETQVNTLNEEIQALRAEKATPVNLDEINKTIDSLLAEKTKSEENKTSKEIQRLENEFRDTTNTLRGNTHFAMNEVNEMRRELNQMQNKKAEQDDLMSQFPNALEGVNFQKVLTPQANNKDLSWFKRMSRQ